MTQSIEIHPTTAADVSGLQRVLDGTGLFPSDMLPAMLAGFLNGAEDELWLTCRLDGAPVALCYAAPEPFTASTWNMRALGVKPALQGHGLGARLVADLETRLRTAGARVLIVDTSGTDAFARARAFYEKVGYELEARIRDFWAPGDDKVTFRKHLG